MGPPGCCGTDDAKDGGFLAGQIPVQWSSRIGGGTEQVQRNIMRARCSGLPKSPATIATSRSERCPVGPR